MNEQLIRQIVEEVPKKFTLTNSIIHKCPALRLPQSFLQKLGNTAQIVALKGCDANMAQFILDACNAALSQEKANGCS